MLGKTWRLGGLALLVTAIHAGVVAGQVFVQAQVNGQAQGGAGFKQPANPLGQWLGWLSMPQIQQEIEVLPEQLEQLNQARTEITQKLSGRYKELSELPAEERQAKYLEAYRGFSDESDQKVREILLPHQINRLRQIAWQMRMSSAGYGGGLGGEDLAKELDITEEQQAELREKQKEVQAEVRRKTQEFYKQLNEESLEQVLSVLTPAQRQKLQELLGEKFEWQRQQPAPAVSSGEKKS